MKFLKRVLATTVAAITLAVLGITTAGAEANLYTTPGGHVVNDRLWSTDCSKYSSDIVRCTTLIWSTQVRYDRGTYKQVTGWHFNNLTYLPASRGRWGTNPLATTGSWTSSGRQWKTVCDDPATTGIGACRSYVWGKVVGATRTSAGWVYSNRDTWVFNNIVLFARPGVPAVTSVPGWVIDQSRLEPTGLGPLRVGTDARNLARLGYTRRVTSDVCDYWDVSTALKNRGVGMTFAGDSVYTVRVDRSGVRTQAGAHVGMTVGQVKALYGSGFTVVTKTNYGETQYFGTYRAGAYELQFRVKGPGDAYAPTVPLVDSDVIAEISAQRFTNDVSFDGC